MMVRRESILFHGSPSLLHLVRVRSPRAEPFTLDVKNN